MRHLHSIYAAALAALALGGCAAVETRPAIAAGATGEGITYNLPRAQFTLTIVETRGVLTVSLGGPEMSADETARLEARLPHNGASDDNVTITVDPHTHLLTRIEATSVGRLTDIAANLARSIGMLQGAEEVVGTTIFEGRFDAYDFADTVARANETLRGYYASRCTRLTAASQTFAAELAAAGYSDDDAKKALRDRLLLCRQLRDAGLTADPGTGLISIALDSPSAATLAAAVSTPPDLRPCVQGICYRPMRPVQFTLRVGNYFSRTGTFMMPDPSRVQFVDLSSGLFAQQKYTLAFTDGVLTSYQQDAHSELVGLARLPGDVVAALLAAPAEALGLRQRGLEAENNYLAAVRSNAEAQNQTMAVCRENPNACPATAYRVMRISLAPRQSPADNVTTTGAGTGTGTGNGTGNANGNGNGGNNSTGSNDGVPIGPG